MDLQTITIPAPTKAWARTITVGPLWATIGRAHERRTWVEAFAPPRSYGRWVLAGILGYYLCLGADR